MIASFSAAKVFVDVLARCALDAADLAAGFDLCLDLHDGFLVRCKSVRWRACAFGLDAAELAAGLDLGLHFHGLLSRLESC
jgi:hypothetical protein